MPAVPRPSLAAVLAAALLALLALALPPAPAEAKRVSISTRHVNARVAVFKVAGVTPGAIRSATLRTGRFSRRLRVQRVRRGARRGHLKVKMPRRARRAGVSRLHRARLTLVVASPPARPGVKAAVAGFEGGNFSEVDSFSSWEGSLSVGSGNAYEGARAAHASFAGHGSSGAQRVWRQVSWNRGSDVWYGVALYVPDTSAWCYWNPIRWDNYKTYGSKGDVGGLSVENGRLNVIQNHYGQSERKLISGPGLPRGRWTWVEVHQRLSSSDGEALSELYVDGSRVGSSSAANSAGRVVNHLRYGVVNVAGSCSRPGSVDFDRVSLSDGMIGPRP